MTKSLSYEDVLNMNPMELVDWLLTEFGEELPEKIETVDEMEMAGRLMLRLSGNYSYLTALSAYARIAVREAKRNKSKKEYEDMVDRKEIINSITDAVKQQYAAISRSVTIHTENNKELQMNGGVIS